MADPVITVTRTVMDGQVVRWHRDLLAATNNSPVLSASRRGVMVHNNAYLNTIPAGWLANATEVFEHLAAVRGADLSHLATHRTRGLFGPLEPVRTAEENADA